MLNQVLRSSVEKLVDQVIPEVIEIRRDIHRHPELAFKEQRASSRVQDWLKANGIEVRTGMAETGVIGLLRGSGNRTVGLRAEMDALPITEETGVSYTSENQGISHACGHDGHLAIVMGTAKILSMLRSKLNGNVKFIFQPAEEAGNGAEKMCNEGTLNDPPVNTVFALHSWPDLSAGEIGIRYGAMMASAEDFELTIYGKGGHAAHPHKAIDPIVMSAKVVESFQTIISRRIKPLAPAVLTIGKIEGGSAPNVIPDSVFLSGTVRAFDEETRERIFTEMTRVIESVAHMFQAPPPKMKIIERIPPTINDDRMADLVIRVGKAVLGEDKVKTLPEPSMGAEDFSFYLQRVPGAIFRLGVDSLGSSHAYLHSSRFNFNDDAIRTGLQMMTSIALDSLSTNSVT